MSPKSGGAASAAPWRPKTQALLAIPRPIPFMAMMARLPRRLVAGLGLARVTLGLGFFSRLLLLLACGIASRTGWRTLISLHGALCVWAQFW